MDWLGVDTSQLVTAVDNNKISSCRRRPGEPIRND